MKPYIVNDKFVELKGEALETFKKEATAEQLGDYYNSLFEAKSNQMRESIETKASKDVIEAIKAELNEVKQEAIKLAGELVAMKEKSFKEEELPTIKSQLEANIDKLKNLTNPDKSIARNSGFSFVAKAVGDMSITGNVTGEIPQAQRLSGLNTIASRAVRFLDILTKGTASSNLISWAYQTNKDGSAGQTEEGATKNQIDFDMLVGSQKIEKTTAFIKVTDEMLEDIDFIESEIRNELSRELLKAVELGAYSGNGTTPNLNGVRTVATAFSAGTFASAVENANEVDVLSVAMNQIAIAHQDAPTHILVNPSTITKLKMIKVSSSDKRYVDFQNRFVVTNGQAFIDGVPVIGTTLVTAGQYLIGDFSRAFLFEKGGVSIDVGLDGNDFTKNFKTIRAEWRGAVVVKNNDRPAFVKGVFATDIAAILAS
jgi:HK97 family phage major capsid protein